MHELTRTFQYYRPWDLLPDEEDRIEQQIADTQASTDREVEEFEARRGQTRSVEGDGMSTLGLYGVEW